GRNLLLSPLDWALIENWQERGVPLAVVLRSIEKVFDGVDQQPKSKRPIKSLMYCREEIEAQYADWLDAQVGKNGSDKVQSSKIKFPSSETEDTSSAKNELFPAQIISAHLEKVTEQLNSAGEKAKGDLRETLQKVIERLSKLKQNLENAEKLEEALEKLDTFIDESLLKSFETEKLKGEIEKQLSSYRNKMEREVYERTFDLILFKRLREKAEIPRLSLFYL
ncbi:MAG: hypothetical protein LC768_18845, partial [Acidobacteria bacterium]|nr:hypothetical protein [Acidobacteriota bacterium]MCA1640348.1 hypothetical protein [Acidobacteriota bacterium]